ncbi:unnamed protein product, partial [Schistosoma curassoni]|uniref:Fibronectin type-III domain-containing protein n=1 Tax=Schistosoma curassoni TaxID=6186 RepID=A0A183L5V4_9TREM
LQNPDYLVERCDETGIWERVSGLVTDNSINVKNLIKGKSYRFRVSAVNMIGNSEPGETKTAILAKNPYGMFNVFNECMLYLIRFITY